ncbi:enoyl-CoA hydratase/isomerase family protein [Pseudooceanicola aestuarii]|uniref:enoyl-CoA hydratase/isomerase family protein n=1 Tax=Pseudooceanicola aestuarii TaxID=2697319 RepID=UPI0013D69F21|nr:enoyl-CoA hydratase/isomerase family protein [Pseudooceanicola aestuarii]
MSELTIRIQGRAGRITLTRPSALNALTHDMALQIETALNDWAGDPAVALVLIDAQGDRAFCAGGDIQRLYETGRAGDLSYGREFWRDEYRLNALIAGYGKPVASFLNGFVMGGGVGIGCHASHRVVEDSTRIAMPEVGIGLVPDVGGSLLLARAPGRLGEYLGLTAGRMGPGDAIHAGFADFYVPQDKWNDIKNLVCEAGAMDELVAAAKPPPDAALAARGPEIDRLFAAADLPGIVTALQAEGTEFADKALTLLSRNCPLSMACTLAMLPRLRGAEVTISDALALEYRFTSRAMADGDFIEGIRAAIIDRDRAPRWSHGLHDVSDTKVAAMLAPLDPDLTFEEDTR